MLVSRVRGTSRNTLWLDEDVDDAMKLLGPIVESAGSFSDLKSRALEAAAARERSLSTPQTAAKPKRGRHGHHGKAAAAAPAPSRGEQRSKHAEDEDMTYGTIADFPQAWFARVETRAITERGKREAARLQGRRAAVNDLSEEDRKKFAAALKQLPFVKDILSSRRRDPTSTKRASWQGGKHLVDMVEWLHEQDGRDFDKSATLATIAEAERFLEAMIEPQLLSKIQARA